MPNDILDPQNFTMTANPDSIKGVQASETFKVVAHGDHALNEGGQQIGFAKYRFDGPAYDKLQRENNNIKEVISEINRSANGLKNQLGQINDTQTALSAHQSGQNRLSDGDAAQLQADLEAQQGQLPGKIEAAAKTLRKAQKALPDIEFVQRDFSVENPAQLADEMTNLSTDLETHGADIMERSSDMAKVGEMADNLYGPNGTELHLNKPPDRGLLTRQVAAHEADKVLGLNTTAPEKFGLDGKDAPIGVSVQAHGAGITGLNNGQDSYLEVDLSNPEIQRGFYDLEAVDYITGQIDRHPGNMFVDTVTNKVTGIDNDMCFPEISREEMFQQGGEYTAKMVEGLPMYMHEETAAKIKEMSALDLTGALEKLQRPPGTPPLSREAIQGAADRLTDLQNALDNKSIKVVKQFDQKTYEASMKAQSATMGLQDFRAQADQIHKFNNNKPRACYLAAAEVQVSVYKQKNIAPRVDSPMAKLNGPALTDMARDTAAQLKTLQDLKVEKTAELQKEANKSGLAKLLAGSKPQKIEGELREIGKQIAKLEAQSDRIFKQADAATAQVIGPMLGKAKWEQGAQQAPQQQGWNQHRPVRDFLGPQRQPQRGNQLGAGHRAGGPG